MKMRTAWLELHCGRAVVSFCRTMDRSMNSVVRKVAHGQTFNTVRVWGGLVQRKKQVRDYFSKWRVAARSAVIFENCDCRGVLYELVSLIAECKKKSLPVYWPFKKVLTIFSRCVHSAIQVFCMQRLLWATVKLRKCWWDILCRYENQFSHGTLININTSMVPDFSTNMVTSRSSLTNLDDVRCRNFKNSCFCIT